TPQPPSNASFRVLNQATCYPVVVTPWPPAASGPQHLEDQVLSDVLVVEVRRRGHQTVSGAGQPRPQAVEQVTRGRRVGVEAVGLEQGLPRPAVVRRSFVADG